MDAGGGRVPEADFVRELCKSVRTVCLIAFSCSATKASLAAATIFVLDKKTDLISAPHALVYLGVVILFVYFWMSSMLLGIADPFLPFENVVSAIFLGGIMDSLQEMFYGKPKGEESEEKKAGKDYSCSYGVYIRAYILLSSD